MYHLKFSLRSGGGGACSAGCSNSSVIVLSFRGCVYSGNPPSLFSNRSRPKPKIQSTTKKNSPKMKTATMTTVVVASTSLREGVTTLRISLRTSLRKRVKSFHATIGFFQLGSSSPRTSAAFVAMLPFLRVQHPAGRIRASFVLNLAGAEGFEPPSSVLETDSLTVELTPLSAVLSFQC